MISSSKHMAAVADSRAQIACLYDRWLLIAVVGLISLGLLMVTSASSMLSNRLYGYPLYFLSRQAIYLLLGVLGGCVLLRIPFSTWAGLSRYVLVGCFLLLFSVFIPGLGKEVNGSLRWLALGPVNFQVSELVKLGVIFYIAGYLVRHQADIRQTLTRFLTPMAIVAILGGLLLLQPDFGATVVIFVTAAGLLFVAGLPLRIFVLLLLVAGLALAALSIASPYRLERLTTFLHPWAYQFDSGYQLTQSLIAFGQGGWTGVGLGDSIQKLLYLPEAHTDFIYAVLTEELGFVGGFILILLFAIMIYRLLFIAKRVYAQGRLFSAFCVFGFAFWMSAQVLISLGVNMGALPTKGLTLPFISYGGSSLLVNCFMIALAFRVDYESRLQMLGLKSGREI